VNRRALAAALALGLPAAPQAYVRSTTAGSGCPAGAAMPLAWPSSPVPYVVDASGTADEPGTAVLDAVDASFAPWQAQACTGLRFRADPRVADPPVGFVQGGANANVVKWLSTWTQSASALAVTLVTFRCSDGAILDADIVLNDANFAFSSSPSATTVGVQNTVTHEVGHVVGFDHTPDPESTMYADAQFGETKKRDLTADDVAGLCAVYPASVAPPPAPSPPAPSPHGGCDSAGGAGGAALALLGLARRARRGARPR
jgi:hypothetical protein